MILKILSNEFQFQVEHRRKKVYFILKKIILRPSKAIKLDGFEYFQKTLESNLKINGTSCGTNLKSMETLLTTHRPENTRPII